VQTVHDVQLGDALGLHLLRQLDRLLDPHRVRVGLAGLALKAAVRTGSSAHVRQVQVPVDVEVRAVTVLDRAHMVRKLAEPCKVVAGIKRDAVVVGQSLAGENLGFELTLQAAVHVSSMHARGSRRTVGVLSTPVLAGRSVYYRAPDDRGDAQRSSGDSLPHPAPLFHHSVTHGDRLVTTTPTFLPAKQLSGAKGRRDHTTRVDILWGLAKALGDSVSQRSTVSQRKAHLVENRDRLLTPGEVASLFRVDPKTVTRWAASGRIGSIRTPGGHRRFRESEVRALLRGDSDLDSIGSLALEASEG
jgi:excisionase family DNA binding protein